MSVLPVHWLQAVPDYSPAPAVCVETGGSKVIMYLFEDVMKMRAERNFIGHAQKNGKMIFSEICKAFEQEGEKIFGITDMGRSIYESKDSICWICSAL